MTSEARGGQPAKLSGAVCGALLAGFLGTALLVYRPALDGPFVSDDLHYVERNPWVHEWSLRNAVEILDPTGAAAVSVVNYAPVQLLLHNLAWQLFGEDTRGHHLLNVGLHAAASLLLVLLLLQSGVPRVSAVLGGSFFLLHPANVEAVAWISQLKSSASLGLSLAALLVLPRRALLATALFTAALLAKPTAAFALPVGLLFEWAREGRLRRAWPIAWTLALALFAIAEFSVHQRSGAADPVLYETPLVLVRTAFALGSRYLVMAATSHGVSAFHEPEPVTSALDAWWLGALIALALLVWRCVIAARRRREELAWWVWALISFAPVSQIFPFLYPMADRYLYFVLPGLIGAALLMGMDAEERLRLRSASLGRIGSRAALAACLATGVVFAVRSAERARIWRSPAALVADAAAHYPSGVSARLLSAKRAARQGDASAAVRELRAAVDRGYNRYEQLLSDAAFAPLRDHPEFRALVSEVAGVWIERIGGREDLTQLEYLALARAHFARAETELAVLALERALREGGPYDPEIRALLAELGRAP